MKGQFLLDNRFAQVLLARLKRTGTSLSHFGMRFDISEVEMTNIINGRVPFTSVLTFSHLDRYFGTQDGYWKEVYENTYRLALAELENAGEEEEVPPTSPIESNKDTVIVPVDLLQCLYDIACEHNYPIAADACEILTKHREGKE